MFKFIFKFSSESLNYKLLPKAVCVVSYCESCTANAFICLSTKTNILYCCCATVKGNSETYRYDNWKYLNGKVKNKFFFIFFFILIWKTIDTWIVIALHCLGVRGRSITQNKKPRASVSVAARRHIICIKQFRESCKTERAEALEDPGWPALF